MHRRIAILLHTSFTLGEALARRATTALCANHQSTATDRGATEPRTATDCGATEPSEAMDRGATKTSAGDTAPQRVAAARDAHTRTYHVHPQPRLWRARRRPPGRRQAQGPGTLAEPRDWTVTVRRHHQTRRRLHCPSPVGLLTIRPRPTSSRFTQLDPTLPTVSTCLSRPCRP